MERNRKNCAEDVAFEIIFDKGAKCCRVEIWRRLIQVEVRKGVSVYWGEIKSRKVSLGHFKGGTLNVSLNLFYFVGIRKLWKAFQLESNTIAVYLRKPFGRWNNLVERSDGEMKNYFSYSHFPLMDVMPTIRVLFNFCLSPFYLYLHHSIKYDM